MGSLDVVNRRHGIDCLHCRLLSSIETFKTIKLRMDMEPSDDEVVRALTMALAEFVHDNYSSLRATQALTEINEHLPIIVAQLEITSAAEGRGPGGFA